MKNNNNNIINSQMRLELNFELISNSLNKKIFIYKIEQNQKQNKKEDIRDTIRRISYSLYTQFIKNDYDILYYAEYIYIDYTFKIFLFLVCEEEINDLVQQTVLQYEYIQEYSYNESHKKLSYAFLQNNYKKLLRTFLDNYFIDCKCEKMGDYYLLNKLSTPSLQQNNTHSDYSYYLAYIITNDNIKLKALYSNGNCFYCNILFYLESGVIYLKECSDYYSFKKTKGPYYNKKYLTELKVYSQGKSGMQLIDTKTNYCSPYKTISSKLLLSYPFIYFSKSKFAFPYLMNTAIGFFQHSPFKTQLFNISIGNIILNQSDMSFVNTRLSLFNEEDVIALSQKISDLLEKHDKIYPFLILYHQYYSIVNDNQHSPTFNQDINIFNLIALYFYYNLTQYQEIFIAGSDSTSNQPVIFQVDKSHSLLFEYKVLEYFLLINDYYNNLIDTQDNSQGTTSSSPSPISFNLSSDNNNNKSKDKENQNRRSSNSNSNEMKYEENLPVSFKKSSLKPYNKDDILTQNKCKVDYGNKCATKRDIKKREQDIKISIKAANEKLQTQFEDQFLKSTFIEDKKKVLFSIHYDKDRLFSRLNPKKQD